MSHWTRTLYVLLIGVFGLVGAVAAQSESNRIEAIAAAEQGGSVFVRLRFAEPVDAPPPSFSIARPARIAFDFTATANGLGRDAQSFNLGDLRSANIVEAGERTRLVLNLQRSMPYEVRNNGKEMVIVLTPVRTAAASGGSVAATPADVSFAPSARAMSGGSSVRDINFRRGAEGEGRVLVELSADDAGVDIRRQGESLVVEFLDTMLPEHLQRRSDVLDFGTPVSSMTARQVGNNVQLTVSPNGLWEHNAYQSNNQFVLEVRRLIEDPNKLVQSAPRGGYGGEPLSLNFQNIDVRAVLQVIADFTDFNIITSDSVAGNLTLRLNDVPWDQALDIILQSKGLDKRKEGNVIWIAPADELAAREKLQLESRAQITDLEPLQTESFQINYHRATEIAEFLGAAGEQTVLSSRGSAVVDDRTNKLFVTDVASRLDGVRRLVSEIDIPPRQVLIEARIVEASKDFVRDLGVRLGVGGASGNVIGYDSSGAPVRQVSFGGGLGSTQATAGQVSSVTDSLPGGLNLNLPAVGASALSMVLWNNSATRFLNLELSALETNGKGKIISSPRVLTANSVEALIEQGTEIPYREASSSGAATTAFKKAVLSLKVKPLITPDGRVQLTVAVNKDRPEVVAGFDVPAIDTKNVRTEVLVENGGTVVIGGIYEETETTARTQVPVLGDIPVLGHLFRRDQRDFGRSELLVFITPRIVSDDLTLR